MSFLHKPATGGYSTAAGKFNQGTMLIAESVEERIEAYDWLTSRQELVHELQITNMLPGWNKHDDDVIPGIAENIGPIHRGGRFRDIVKYQLEKLLRALVKVDDALVAIGEKPLVLPDYFVPKNMAETDPMLSSQLVKRYNDIRKIGDNVNANHTQDRNTVRDHIKQQHTEFKQGQ